MSEMRTSLEVIAPSVEEAIAQGVEELGIPEEELEVEVLDEGSKGFLGLGTRQVRIRLTVRIEEPREEILQEEAPQVEEPIRYEEPSDVDDDEAVRIAHETVEELLQRMGIRANVTAQWGELEPPGKIRPLLIDIRGDDLSILIGRRGETLSALQYITRLIVGKELKRPVAVVIDIEGYRARREGQLRRLARKIAEQAIETGRTMNLEPMPANERRIIHVELKDNPKVETLSIGEGNRRKVTVIPQQE
ncbi:MAG: Jag N-terminal domain-containing protein [Anaerolineaceae bacterium]|nr:MAG: Jag N-terminal domain-containing protein [Anaerolineaceae bacterium]